MTISVRWHSPTGNYQTDVTDYVKLEYFRSKLNPGMLYLDLDPESFDMSLLKTDCWLEPWRETEETSPILDGDTAFFLRDWGLVGKGATKTLKCVAVDPLYILKGTICAYAQGHGKDEITAVAADDAMKLLVKENRGASVDTSATPLDLSAWDLTTWMTVAADLSQCATLTNFTCSGQNILRLLQQISKWSQSQGTYLTADIIRKGSIFEFRTYKNQRKVDRSDQTGASPLIFTEERGNIEDIEEWERHMDEANVVFATAGAGNTIGATSSDTAAIGQSPFNRRGLWYPAQSSVAAEIQAEADAERYANRAKRTFTGNLKDTPDCLYGVDYHYGDIVHCQGQLGSYDAHIDSLHVTVQDGKETRRLPVSYEG